MFTLLCVLYICLRVVVLTVVKIHGNCWKMKRRSIKDCSLAVILFFLGDFNAYTSEEVELQVGEPLVNVPGQNVCWENDCEYVFPIRKSRDRFRKINRWGRNLIDFCKKEGLLIMNGRLGGDFGKGDFTCYSGSWPSLIDYILCSLSLWPQAMDLRILELVGSGHFSVSTMGIFPLKWGFFKSFRGKSFFRDLGIFPLPWTFREILGGFPLICSLSSSS